MESLAVLGLGNVLMQDDAAGPHVIAALRAGWLIPDGIEVEELGTPGFDLVPYLSGRDTVILVDAVRADAEPGTVRVYRRDEILAHPPGPSYQPARPGSQGDPAVARVLRRRPEGGRAGRHRAAAHRSGNRPVSHRRLRRAARGGGGARRARASRRACRAAADGGAGGGCGGKPPDPRRADPGGHGLLLGPRRGRPRRSRRRAYARASEPPSSSRPAGRWRSEGSRDPSRSSSRVRGERSTSWSARAISSSTSAIARSP